MKRSLKGVVKYLLLVLCTIFTTVIIFNYVRHPRAGSKNFRNGRAIMPVAPEQFRISDTENEIHISGKHRIDWHDYKRMEEESKRKGNGENGVPAKLPSNFVRSNKEKLFKANGFNALLSDHIALNRSVPDIRHEECKKRKYLADLPSVSVIVPFHNEHLSTLLRTAISVLNRSPAHLIKEIILVDDCSTKDICKKPLDDYVSTHLPKVRVIRLAKRVGLIRARLAGAKQAVGKVLIFLDSHTEANVNWLPPLLDPIAEDYKTCVCPFIDVIAYETFEYRAQDEGKRGAFDWELYYKRLPRLPEDDNNPSEPFKSPVMAGGLFAISKAFFWELGGYDSGLDIWGGEQYELSFKIWQCGGRMLDAPCSRVGHIYRKFAPFPNPGLGDFVGRNYRRVAEVWMDEYAEYLYKRRPHYRHIDPGDLTEQKAIRARLHCKPFSWFMKEVAFDLVKVYPPVEPPDYASGRIRNEVATEYCVHLKSKDAEEKLSLQQCNKKGKRVGEQYFNLTWHKDIRVKGGGMCWDVANPDDEAAIQLYTCHGLHGNQLWKYDMDKKWLVHGMNPRCLDADLSRKRVFVTTCDENSETQRWLIDNINYKELMKWEYSI
ncbi:LOW QUALITY PROTEIN: putative polypeptide N-acetylgalactosaminyltransferase 10 [Nilaparvata lugens]|uniref:LOW QUALITY PROTEIN: putative polypeptide N-acetylgalactosaminyltransferase 10 n=1 Tax=Nilaparvata lugens TaxID=108931 RepID=UPI00193E08ED|nr:LOW QUALITY PROTEIN: putative polypeptide N-acetylgalactosaminyltransferase 10 [Nilaparvata lugens]